MNVTVRAFAEIRELLGKELAVSVPDSSTVGDLLQLLNLAAGGRSLIILKNGRNIHSLQGSETPLSDGDIVAIFPLVAGG